MFTGPTQRRRNLVLNYISALLSAFIEAGLVDVLTVLAEDREREDNAALSSREVAAKAMLLLGELLHMSNVLLPSSQCGRLQALPMLVRHANCYSLDARLRSRASTIVTNLHRCACVCERKAR